MGSRCNESIAEAIAIGRHANAGAALEYEVRLAPTVTAGWDFSLCADSPLEVSHVVAYETGWRCVTHADGKKTWCHKLRHAWHPLADGAGKFTVSSEQEHEAGDGDVAAVAAPGRMTLLRLRARKSLAIGNHCRVDVTDTWSAAPTESIDQETAPRTEVEIEWIGPADAQAAAIEAALLGGLGWAKRNFTPRK